MKRAFSLPILSTLLTIVLLGCKSYYPPTLPHILAERGTWVGEASSKTVYEMNGQAVQGLCILTQPGAVRKRSIFSDKPVLIDSKGVLIDFRSFIGKKIKVRGLIYLDDPINPADGRLLYSQPDMSKTTNYYSIFECVDVIKIDPAKIHIVSR